ncbi:MAG: cysteine--tRNA ligase [Tepidisphaerales bacterium]
MTLRVYSTLTRTKEPFDTVQPGRVGMYLCGPTVYKSPHIGHLVGPVVFDAVKRYLTFLGYSVTWVINITDVDDKLIDASRRTGVPMARLAEKYTAEYMDALRRLGVDTVDHFPRATDHIDTIIELCQRLIRRGYAYVADGSVYFDVTRDEDYGKLSRRKITEQSGDGGEGSGKRNPADFALWKAAKEGEPAWPCPWSERGGRPGWHIECSAMAMSLLGESFDIHGGGMDLLFPHHENELAQSECATGKPFVRYWMHNGLTRIKTKLSSGEWADEKMSGSLGNVVSAGELLDRWGPEVLRYFLLSTHYRSPIEFTDKALSDAAKGYGSLARAVGHTAEATPAETAASPKDPWPDDALETLRGQFLAAMDDDFNTAGALAALHQMAGELNRRPDGQAKSALQAAVRRLAREVLGLMRFAPGVPSAGGGDDALTEQLMRLLIRLRAEARSVKNFAVADQIRKELDGIGVVLEDKPDGTVWRRK